MPAPSSPGRQQVPRTARPEDEDDAGKGGTVQHPRVAAHGVWTAAERSSGRGMTHPSPVLMPLRRGFATRAHDPAATADARKHPVTAL
jgi:hypothetical protein